MVNLGWNKKIKKNVLINIFITDTVLRFLLHLKVKTPKWLFPSRS